jgi:hypothetical protein
MYSHMGYTSYKNSKKKYKHKRKTLFWLKIQYIKFDVMEKFCLNLETEYQNQF